MATSGDYHNYFERDGVRYSHTRDPRTGQPITPWLGVGIGGASKLPLRRWLGHGDQRDGAGKGICVCRSPRLGRVYDRAARGWIRGKNDFSV